jgi:response regulator RpfG family c-di-GMP phosphodiesterase
MNVLFIEDQPTIRKCGEILLNKKDITILAAATVEEAKHLISNNKIDMVVSDIIMIDPKTKLDNTKELLKIIDVLVSKGIKVAFHTGATWKEYPNLKGIKFLPKGAYNDILIEIRLHQKKVIAQSIPKNQLNKLANPEEHYAFSEKRALIKALKDWANISVKNKKLVFYNFEISQLRKELNSGSLTKKEINLRLSALENAFNKINKLNNYAIFTFKPKTISKKKPIISKKK